MRAIICAAGATLLVVVTPAFAHRLDEYLEATTISVEKDRVRAQIRLAPGVHAFPQVFAVIDGDGDGRISSAEERAYAERVIGDLALRIDGERLTLRVVSSMYASLGELREGRGEIRIGFDADVPRGSSDRRLSFANHHLRPIAAYLVNGLVSEDPSIQVRSQIRSWDQSYYQMDYAQAGVASSPPAAWWSRTAAWLGAAALALFVGLTLLRR